MENAKRLALVPKLSAEESSGLTARSDDDLMLLARGGIERAFATLIQRHQARLLRVAARYLADDALAADVAQNTFVQIYRALPKYEARGKFEPYLYRVLLNQCHMVRRAARAEQSAVRELSPAPADEAEVLLRERDRDLQSALGRLSPKLRSVVLLRYGADLDYGEIAEALELPSGTVKRRLFDAMIKLRSAMEGQ
ncbi:MAG: sigma-70 family RNA polymerase sigma factor [Polyangiaceae bacterium]